MLYPFSPFLLMLIFFCSYHHHSSHGCSFSQNEAGNSLCAGMLMAVLCVWLSALLCFLNLRWSHHSQQYTSVTTCWSTWVFEHLLSFTSSMGLKRHSLEGFSLIPQGFSKTRVISCGPEIVSFSCKRRKKGI